MISNKAFAYDLSVPERIPEYTPNKKDFKVIKNPNKVGKINHDQNNEKKPAKKPKSKLSLLVSLLLIFGMCIIISLRYNYVSEKNLELQRLKYELSEVSSELATTEVMVDKVIDKDTVEAYAKQQLGMQKPAKNQIVYVNSDFDVSVNEVESENFFIQGLNKLKNLIGIK